MKAPQLLPQRSASPSQSGVNQLRRSLLTALPLAALAPVSLAQQPAPVEVRKLHSFTIRVSDLARSLDFYQDIFGAAVLARGADRVSLRIGPGPRCFILQQMAAGEAPGFSHIGLSVADFDIPRIQDRLAAFGVSPGQAPAVGTDPLAMAMQSWTQQQGETRHLFFSDAEGVRYQLIPTDYCGGGGSFGSDCAAAQPANQEGLMQLVDINHFTTFLANRDRANDFFTRAFGKQFQAYQGPGSPVIGVGDGKQFLMYVGGNQPGRPANPGRIDHVSFAVEDFSVDAILQRLTDYGLRARPEPGDEQPLMHWVSLRMPNRGGAEGGTPEVYFSDPDGIRIQVQDPSYCGGGGYLGDSCPPL